MCAEHYGILYVSEPAVKLSGTTTIVVLVLVLMLVLVLVLVLLLATPDCVQKASCCVLEQLPTLVPNIKSYL